MNPALKKLSTWYSSLSPHSLQNIAQFYAPEAYFKDPFNEVTGLPQIQHIFEHMFIALDNPRFVILDSVQQGDAAFLTWEFIFSLKGRSYTVLGSSHFRFNAAGLVVFHRDYWDAAEELWQKLPILGGAVRWLRGKFAVK